MNKRGLVAGLCALVILIAIPGAVALSNTHQTEEGGLPWPIQPWRPDMEPYESDVEGPDPWCNWTIAYVGFSHVSEMIINATDSVARACGWFPPVWVKEPDFTRPIDADLLLIDGFWMMNNTELGAKYIASFLSIKGEPPRMRYNKWYEKPVYCQALMGERNERPVAVLAGFRPGKVMKAIEDLLVSVGLMRDPRTSKVQIGTAPEVAEMEVRELYGDALSWWAVLLDKVGWRYYGNVVVTFADGTRTTIYEYFGKGTYYVMGFHDYTESPEDVADLPPDLPDFLKVALTPEAFANNDPLAWEKYLLHYVIWYLIESLAE